MSVEKRRGRLVTAMVAASLLQDTALLVSNVAAGASSLCNSVAASFSNYAHTFRFLYQDQASKYRDLTGLDFGRTDPVLVMKDSEEEDDE